MDWRTLQAYLEQTGRADVDGVRRKARYTRCGDCGAEVLVGLDADVAGCVRMTDVVDLDRTAELVALLTGRRTLRVLELPDGLRFAHRQPEVIRSAKQDRPVVADHRCGAPPIPSTAFRWRIPTRAAAAGDVPPF
jgi:hypothetical protein